MVLINKVVHFEIPSKDKEKLKDFYSKIFDWKFIDMPEMNYTIIRTAETDDKGMMKEKGAINGGMTQDDPVGMPVLVVNVENIDESMEKIKAVGAKFVMEKTKVGDMGLYARFQDLDGNVIGIWQDVKK